MSTTLPSADMRVSRIPWVMPPRGGIPNMPIDSQDLTGDRPMTHAKLATHGPWPTQSLLTLLPRNRPLATHGHHHRQPVTPHRLAAPPASTSTTRHEILGAQRPVAYPAHRRPAICGSLSTTAASPHRRVTTAFPGTSSMSGGYTCWNVRKALGDLTGTITTTTQPPNTSPPSRRHVAPPVWPLCSAAMLSEYRDNKRYMNLKHGSIRCLPPSYKIYPTRQSVGSSLSITYHTPCFTRVCRTYRVCRLGHGIPMGSATKKAHIPIYGRQ